jgi:hypothetical protein
VDIKRNGSSGKGIIRMDEKKGLLREFLKQGKRQNGRGKAPAEMGG